MLEITIQALQDSLAAIAAQPPLAAFLTVAVLFGMRRHLRRLVIRAIFALALVPRRGRDTVVEARRAIVHVRPALGGWIVLAYAKPEAGALVRTTASGAVAPVPAATIDRLRPAYAGFFVARGEVARATRAISRLFS